MATCCDLADLVSAWLDARLPPEEAAAFEAHLRLCPPCVQYVDQLRLTRAALGGLPPLEPPPRLESAMLEHFRAWKRAN